MATVGNKTSFIVGFLVVMVSLCSCSLQEPELTPVFVGNEEDSKGIYRSAIEVYETTATAREYFISQDGVLCGYKNKTPVTQAITEGVFIQGHYTDGTIQSESVQDATFTKPESLLGIHSITVSLGIYLNEPCSDSYTAVVYDQNSMIPVLSCTGKLASFATHLNQNSLSVTLQDKNYTVQNFSIARTETAYSLWQEVYNWATSKDRGEKVYTFRNSGQCGSGASCTAECPVTQVNLCDIRVWCNAISEMQGLSPVYLDSNGEVLRNSAETARITSCTVANTNGFRLPTEAEWCVAAKGGLASYAAHVASATDSLPFDLKTSPWQYPYAGFNDTLVIKEYIVADTLSCSPCASKKYNILGLYDMGGNVAELTDTVSANGNFITKGGSWMDDADSCNISNSAELHPAALNDTIGFRLARSVF